VAGTALKKACVNSTASSNPSRARELPDTGDIIMADDLRHRVIVVDRKAKAVAWQFGVTDRAGRAPGYLFCPGGSDLDVFRDWRGVAARP